jgi:DNA (cytosine-5)-methyltransferase 1
MLTHLSLFSGIGGLDLAAEWAGFETVGQCEWAEYQTKVLEKHWPEVPRWRDIHDLSANEFIRRTGRNEITVISGGFPCQPHSVAGKRKASLDERDLWPEYRRIIGEFKPRWIVAENVRGLLSSEDGRFFRGVLRDLANLGFNVGWCTYPAVWVGAIHRRERIFTIAHSKSVRRVFLGENQQNGHADLNFKISEETWRYSSELLPNVRGLFDNPVCGVRRNDDGLAEGVHRLKCLGNMVVPQQAYPIFKAIAEIELGS